ncbi:hypothetical protein MKW92_011216 [Papaver armeniacum]|nr:hypothetical protein MKW92_011216 [Papaver armeniacum]
MAETTRENLLDNHTEKHFTAGAIVRDVIIGVSDGLTVPFALAAGLSGANVGSSIIVTAGLAEVAAGLYLWDGDFNRYYYVTYAHRYLAAKSEEDHYYRELKREQEEIISVPDTEAAEVEEILAQYELQPHEYAPMVNALRNKPQAWLDFMMKFELGLEKPDPRRALESAFTIAFAYILGGLVPLLPYMFIPDAMKAMLTSVGVTLIALLFFGFVKGHFTGNRPFRSAFETALIGTIASAAAYGIAKLVQAK